MLCCSSPLLSSASTLSRRFTFAVTATSSRCVFTFAGAYLISLRSSFTFTCFY
jgi:hypothetical protein